MIKMNKIILILTIILLIILNINCVYASQTQTSVRDPIDALEWYYPGTNSNDSKLAEIGRIIVAIIQVIGVVASVIAIIVIGLRYMFGSVEEKANYKQTMIPYIIGVVMLLSITTLLQILYNFVTGLDK